MLIDTPLATRITVNEAAFKASSDPSNCCITGQVFGVNGGVGTLRAK